MKKNLPIVLILVGVIVLSGVFFLFVRGRGRPSGPEAGPTPTPAPIEERPYITLTPRADGHEFKFEIKRISDTETVEYELVYLAGDLSRGVIGSVDLKGETGISRDLLLGSCSKNVCKYDEGVTEGILTLRFRGPGGTQKYELAFRLQTGNEAKEGLTSGDGNFFFQGSLPGGTFYATHSTIGLPKAPEGKIIGGPYGIFTSGSTTARGTIRLHLAEAAPEVKILGWNSATSTWEEHAKGFETNGEVVSVEVNRLTVFIAVSP